MTRGWRRGGGDDGGHDGDDGYFCILRGSCGGAEATVAAAAGMRRTGDHTRTHTGTRTLRRGSAGGAVVLVTRKALVVAHCMLKCPWKSG